MQILKKKTELLKSKDNTQIDSLSFFLSLSLFLSLSSLSLSLSIYLSLSFSPFISPYLLSIVLYCRNSFVSESSASTFVPLKQAFDRVERHLATRSPINGSFQMLGHFPIDYNGRLLDHSPESYNEVIFLFYKILSSFLARHLPFYFQFPFHHFLSLSLSLSLSFSLLLSSTHSLLSMTSSGVDEQ